MVNNIQRIKKIAYCLAMMAILLSACGKKQEPAPVEVDVEKSVSDASRSSEPECRVPVAGGSDVRGTDEVSIDASNAKDGYFYVVYHGDNPDIKMQIACDNSITYTYKIGMNDTVIPLTQGDGNYKIIVYEGMGDGQYATLYVDEIPVKIEDVFGPYLYPNYYVDFTNESKAIEVGQELASKCTCDLEVIAEVYDYVIEHITYDHDEAQNVATDYVPNVDEILSSGKGICFDYASLMASMLRSQRIPTRLEIGYAGDAYHAWVTTYVQDIGWINGIIQFDGADWTLMDPTFAANADSKTLKQFIGSGDNYTTKYIY